MIVVKASDERIAKDLNLDLPTRLSGGRAV